MNRKLLFSGIFLSIVAVSSIALTSVFATKTDGNLILFSNFDLALQVNFFHAIFLIVLAQLKRKYTDKNLLNGGNVLLVSTLIFSLPAYISIFTKEAIVFELVKVFGIIGLFVGWIVITKAFYDVYYPPRR